MMLKQIRCSYLNTRKASRKMFMGDLHGLCSHSSDSQSRPDFVNNTEYPDCNMGLLSKQ